MNKRTRKPKKPTRIAQAGPGYRPRPGSDAAGNTERMGTKKVYDPHMKMWVPTIKKARLPSQRKGYNV